mgnify:CR=1 FL=1|tara:strand:- start:56 stop:1150 length:1095 start_codon:yes stop_codon:yes gene_type:complete
MKENTIPFVDLYPQYEELKSDIDFALRDIISRSDFITGPTVEDFEKKICEYTGAEACASIGSGTNALICALKALGIKEGHEVMTVGHTFVSTTEAIVNVGATPIFVDIDEFYHMDISKMKPSKKLKAILFVDLYGQTPDIDKIKSFANKHNLFVIEDAAQSFGAEYKGKKVGSLVDLTCFSFNPVKNLGAMGDAGAVTGQKPIIDKVKMFRDHGRRTKFEYETVGYNARIDNLQAVVIQTKLKKIDEWLDKKRKICRRYTQFLQDVVHCPKEASWGQHSYYVYVIETPAGTRDSLQNFLKQKGIGTNIHYRYPTHTTEAYKQYGTSLPRTEYICRNILSLPCYHTLPTHHQDYVIKAIKDFYAN